jgi:S1-C subfamily serine protease
MLRVIRPLLLLVCLLASYSLVPPASAQAVTNNVLLRVLLLKVGGGGTGTGFTLDVEGRQYLITAKHVVNGLKGKTKIEIRQNKNWTPIDVTVFPCADPVDIAVLIPDHVLTDTANMPMEANGSVYVTQEVYFLGFPFGSSAGEHVPAFGTNPIPVAKHGILSEIDRDSVEVDAINNPGFSDRLS